MFKKINFENGYFYTVNECKNFYDSVDWAYQTARKKSNYTFDSWQKRKNLFSKFVDIFYGDLAKNIVNDFLHSMIENISIDEYDKIRDDNFQKHDLYDLRVNNKLIEIKSSLEKSINVPSRFSTSRRIIINVNNMHETLSDYVVQVFFVPNNLNHFTEIENRSSDIISSEEVELLCQKEKEYSKKEIMILIAGWINKEQELQAIKFAKFRNNSFNVSNDLSSAKYRQYANVLIKDTNKMDELIIDIKNLINK